MNLKHFTTFDFSSRLSVSHVLVTEQIIMKSDIGADKGLGRDPN